MSIEQAPCKWSREDGAGNYWWPGCNLGLQLRGATIFNFKFCPYCGNAMFRQDTSPKAKRIVEYSFAPGVKWEIPNER